MNKLNITNILNNQLTLQYHNETLIKPTSLTGIIVPIKRTRDNCEKNQILKEIYKKNPILLYVLFSLKNAEMLGFKTPKKLSEFFNCLIYYIEKYEKKVLKNMKTSKSFKDIKHFNCNKLSTLCDHQSKESNSGNSSNNGNSGNSGNDIQTFYKNYGLLLSNALNIYDETVSSMTNSDFFASVILNNGIYIGHVYNWKSIIIPNTICMTGIYQSIESLLTNQCQKTSIEATKILLFMGGFLALHYKAQYFCIDNPIENIKKIFSNYGFINTSYDNLPFSIIKTTDLIKNIRDTSSILKVNTEIFSFLESQMNLKVKPKYIPNIENFINNLLSSNQPLNNQPLNNQPLNNQPPLNNKLSSKKTSLKIISPVINNEPLRRRSLEKIKKGLKMKKQIINDQETSKKTVRLMKKKYLNELFFSQDNPLTNLFKTLKAITIRKNDSFAYIRRYYFYSTIQVSNNTFTSELSKKLLQKTKDFKLYAQYKLFNKNGVEVFIKILNYPEKKEFHKLIEPKIYEKIETLVQKNYCPHFLTLYGTIQFNYMKFIKEIDGKNIDNEIQKQIVDNVKEYYKRGDHKHLHSDGIAMILERGKGIELGDIISDKSRSQNFYALIIFQLFYTLLVMHQQKITHYDLHNGNIFLQSVEKSDHFRYIYFISSDHYYLLHPDEYEVRIFDWDNSYAEGCSDKNFVPSSGRSSIHNPSYDLFDIYNKKYYFDKVNHKDLIEIINNMKIDKKPSITSKYRPIEEILKDISAICKDRLYHLSINNFDPSYIPGTTNWKDYVFFSNEDIKRMVTEKIVQKDFKSISFEEYK